MDGFAQGVYYYNQVKKKGVRVLGWNRDTKNGEFVGDFANTSKALQISKNFEQAGADVILPVAGGLGGATAQNSIDGKKSVTIWVDTDGFVSANKYRSVLLTSVMKGLGESIQAVIAEVNAGKYTNKAYEGTLANKGTRLAPFHDLASAVPSTLALPSATNSFAHSVAWTRHVVDDIIETGSVHHRWLGVMTTDAPEGGAAIESVTRYGPADRAGLIAGDRIASLSGTNLPTSSALVVALRNHAANDTVTIGYVRNGVAATTFAKLIDRS
jgi:predicted metalloprotease with PDZ domain